MYGSLAPAHLREGSTIVASRTVEQIDTPGAVTSIYDPRCVNDGALSSWSIAVTASVRSSPAGYVTVELGPPLPAAATTKTFRSAAY